MPNLVSTGFEISPGLSLNATTLNSSTMRSLVNTPRSPPLSALGPIEFSLASFAKSAPGAVAFLYISSAFAIASCVHFFLSSGDGSGGFSTEPSVCGPIGIRMCDACTRSASDL